MNEVKIQSNTVTFGIHGIHYEDRQAVNYRAKRMGFTVSDTLPQNMSFVVARGFIADDELAQRLLLENIPIFRFNEFLNFYETGRGAATDIISFNLSFSSEDPTFGGVDRDHVTFEGFTSNTYGTLRRMAFRAGMMVYEKPSNRIKYIVVSESVKYPGLVRRLNRSAVFMTMHQFEHFLDTGELNTIDPYTYGVPDNLQPYDLSIIANSANPNWLRSIAVAQQTEVVKQSAQPTMDVNKPPL